ncbi:uncharacterized protein [Panulirus ornatus]|uniref:uncharacterized protein isoform X2 n=1 Tax=Panulirus ornatus TaxID=150431 RepID=UPI003A853AF9
MCLECGTGGGSSTAALRMSVITHFVEEFQSRQAFIEKYGGRLCIYPKGVCLKRFVGRGHCKEQVRRCDPAWPYHLDVEKCRRYSKVVQYTDSNNLVTIYKNPHCARCNFVNTSSSGLECISPNIKKHLQKARGPNFLPCFSVLMDFKGDKCKSINELWDPIHITCKRIYCGQLYKLENGLCVRDSALYHPSENSTLLDRSCPKLKLFESEYIPRPDGSVFVNVTKKVYKNGEFEMLKEGEILICNDHQYYTAALTMSHKLLTLIVLVTSLTCLGLHIIIYILVPRFRNLPGKNLFSLSCCLFIAHLIFLTGMKATYNYGLCVFLSVALHFFWLASFCWMNIMSVDVCRTFTGHVYRGESDGRRNYIFYSIYAWSIPTFVVTLSLIFNYTDILPEYKPDYGKQLCWINNQYGLAMFFLLPVGAIILENTVLFLVTSCGIYKQAKAAKYANTRSQSVKGEHEPKVAKTLKCEKMHKNGALKHAAQGRRSKKERVRLVLYLKLGLIQGITWVLGFVAAFSDIPEFWYPFTVLNGLQGAFIFLGFDMKKKVGELVWEALVGRPWKKHRKSKETRTTTAGQSSSSQNRSSKSNSDSDGESRSDSVVSQLISGEGVNWQAIEGVTWGRAVKLTPPTCPQTKASPQKARKHKTSVHTDTLQGSSHTGSLKSPPDPLQTTALISGHVEGVRNGDLRASVVKGKFEDEARDDAIGHQPRIGLEDNCTSLRSPYQDASKQQSNKPNLKHVMDLLQQLQQSKKSVDLPDVVQQLLMRCRGPVGDVQRESAALSKCKSFSEGTNPTLQEEQLKAFKSKLQLEECTKQCPAISNFITSAHETQHPSVLTAGLSSYAQISGCHHEEVPLIPSHQPTQHCKRPKSLSNIGDCLHDTSLWSSIMHHVPQVLDDDEGLTQNRIKREKTQEVVHPLERTLKSQSFSQISQVALAAAILQRAAFDAQKKRCQGEEENKGSKTDDRKSLNKNDSNQGRTSESLV